MPWFLCLFIGYIPLEATLRMLDMFFLAGPNILFQMALTLLKLNEQKILAEQQGKFGASSTGELIIMILKNQEYTVDQIMATFDRFSNLPIDRINEQRNAHKMEMVSSLDLTTR